MTKAAGLKILPSQKNTTVIHTPLKSENKWLNPRDNFGVMERGKT